MATNSFDLSHSSLADHERLRFQNGLLVKENVSVRDQMSWFCRLVTRGEYSQSAILSAIKKEYEAAVTKGDLSDPLIHNYEFLIKKAEVQNQTHRSSCWLLRFFEGKTHIKLNGHRNTLDQGLATAIRQGPLTKGNGDYIVFNRKTHAAPSKELFEQAYQILNDSNCQNKFELIKKIDPNLEVAFIPRTLYELIFIRKCVKEDVKAKASCPYLNRHRQEMFNPETDFPGQDEISPKDIKQLHQKRRSERKCWHFYPGRDRRSNREGIQEIAYRLNKAIIKAMKPQDGGFTFQDFTDQTEKELDYLQGDAKGRIDQDRNFPGPVILFDDKESEMIQKSLMLDCSRLAEKSLFLYRGAVFSEDSPEKDGNPISLSYGTSLFAGCVYDVTGKSATAYAHMKKTKNAYVIPIPFDQLNRLDRSPFTMPSNSILDQLFGVGEIFHPRTKAWQGCNVNTIEGFYAGGETTKAHVISNLSREEIHKLFKQYKSRAIHLK